MRPRPLHLIVSCSENRVIGRNGRLPWRIPEDWRFFQAITRGKTVVLGRVCFDTWPGCRRDDRTAVLVSAHPPVGSPRTIAAPSLPSALRLADALENEIFICGGERIYAEALALSRPLRLHLTLVHAQVAGDRHFPDWRRRPWREVARRSGSDASYRYTFLTLDSPAL